MYFVYFVYFRHCRCVFILCSMSFLFKPAPFVLRHDSLFAAFQQEKLPEGPSINVGQISYDIRDEEFTAALVINRRQNQQANALG